MTDGELENVARAIAIAARYGLEADSDAQRVMRVRRWDDGTGWEEDNKTYDTEGEQTVYGKNHYRMLARAALEALAAELLERGGKE